MRTQVLEVTQPNGKSVFYPQYLGWFGRWRTYSDYTGWVVFNTLGRAQTFLEEQRFKSQKRVHPPVSKPQPTPRLANCRGLQEAREAVERLANWPGGK